MTEQLSKYIHAFKNLHRGFSKNLGKAPHKPILLLSILQLIGKGEIHSNNIFITPELLLSFTHNWHTLVRTQHISNFSLPFFHLRSESFWSLVTKPNMELKVTTSKSIKSFKSLNETIDFAEIDEPLFHILLNPLHRTLFEEVLLNEYFPDSKANYASDQRNEEEVKIELQILNENKIKYQQNLKQLKATLNNDDYEKELFIRGGLFKRTIPRIYNYSCCISGMKIESTRNVQMIDACHIVPFSISNDDTITNGLSLSPNLHRAFDRGLITIHQNYTVQVSPTVRENNSVFSLSQFNGKQIILPQKSSWYPSAESLDWHNREVFAN